MTLLTGGLVLGSYAKLKSWADTELAVDGEAIIDFKQGTALLSLAQLLEDRSLVTQAGLFYAWVRLFQNYQTFQAGKYRFTGEVSPREIAQTIIRGETYNPIVLTISIPEGFPLKMIIERLAANKVGTIAELTKLSTDPTFLHSLKVPSKSLEGYLLPATYNFTVMPTPSQAFSEMTKTFWQQLPKDYESRVQALGLTLERAVVFASLIESETMHEDEKSLISEVIWRRLKDNVPLAIDAAVIYGAKDYAGDLKWSHLADASNPYNTRIHRGLPPTPIGAPSVKALEAVLTPANKGSYFYVLMPNSDRHHFSRTLKEHNEEVQKLVNWLKRDKTKK